SRITVGDKVHVEVPGRWVQVNQGVGAGHWLFIPGLLLANLFDVKWPRVIGPLWREEQLDVVICKLQLLAYKSGGVQAQTNEIRGKLATANHGCSVGLTGLALRR